VIDMELPTLQRHLPRWVDRRGAVARVGVSPRRQRGRPLHQLQRRHHQVLTPRWSRRACRAVAQPQESVGQDAAIEEGMNGSRLVPAAAPESAKRVAACWWMRRYGVVARGV